MEKFKIEEIVLYERSHEDKNGNITKTEKVKGKIFDIWGSHNDQIRIWDEDIQRYWDGHISKVEKIKDSP